MIAGAALLIVFCLVYCSLFLVEGCSLAVAAAAAAAAAPAVAASRASTAN